VCVYVCVCGSSRTLGRQNAPAYGSALAALRVSSAYVYEVVVVEHMIDSILQCVHVHVHLAQDLYGRTSQVVDRTSHANRYIGVVMKPSFQLEMKLTILLRTQKQKTQLV